MKKRMKKKNEQKKCKRIPKLKTNQIVIEWANYRNGEEKYNLVKWKSKGWKHHIR